MKGYVQVYTGEGKCKTTAALGLVVRAVGAGLRIYLGQFLKAGVYSEIRVLRERFPEVTVEQFGSGRFVRGRPSRAEIAAARRGLDRVQDALGGGRFDVVIADEIHTAVRAGVLAEADVLALIAGRPPNVELVLTGRGATPAVVAQADLVTEMTCRKHYYDAGVRARPGIEC
jgi:cob(I)alamin adenosyltransferase